MMAERLHQLVSERTQLMRRVVSQHLRGENRMKIQAVAFFLFFCAPVAVQGQESRTLEVNGVSIRYEVAGNGPAIVLLHGWAHSLETWQYLFPHLYSPEAAGLLAHHNQLCGDL